MKGTRFVKRGEGPLLKPPSQPVYARGLDLPRTTMLSRSALSQAERRLRLPHIIGSDDERGHRSSQSRMVTIGLSELLNLHIPVQRFDF